MKNTKAIIDWIFDTTKQIIIRLEKLIVVTLQSVENISKEFCKVLPTLEKTFWKVISIIGLLQFLKYIINNI